MKYVFLLLVMLLFSCASQEDNKDEVILFNGIKFNLLETEKLVDLEKEITETYLEYTSKYPFSVPLFKCIEGKNHTVFIGIPYKISAKEFINYKLAQKINSSDFKNGTDYYFEHYKQGENYISEYLVDFQGNKIYILTLSKSKKIANSLFNYLELSSRFQTNKKQYE